MKNQTQLLAAEGRFAGQDLASGLDLMVYRHANHIGERVSEPKSRSCQVKLDGDIEVPGVIRTYMVESTQSVIAVRDLVKNLREASSMLQIEMIAGGFRIMTSDEDLRRFRDNEYNARAWLTEHPNNKAKQLFDACLPWYDEYEKLSQQYP